VAVPIINGGLTKNGAGTMRLTGANTIAGPVTVNAGVLRSNNAAGFSSSSAITVNGGTLEMNGVTDTVASLEGSGGAVTQGAAGLTLAATTGSTTFAGTITGRAEGDRFQVVARASSFTATLTLVTHGGRQSVMIRSHDNQASIKGVSINLKRSS